MNYEDYRTQRTSSIDGAAIDFPEPGPVEEAEQFVDGKMVSEEMYFKLVEWYGSANDPLSSAPSFPSETQDLVIYQVITHRVKFDLQVSPMVNFPPTHLSSISYRHPSTRYCNKLSNPSNRDRVRWRAQDCLIQLQPEASIRMTSDHFLIWERHSQGHYACYLHLLWYHCIDDAHVFDKTL